MLCYNATRNNSKKVRLNMINKIEEKLKSADDVTELNVVKWLPDGEIKGVIQVAHGITEHAGRYEQFANYFASKGYVVVVNDIVGHGKSISDKKNKMYFGKENSWFYIVEDFHNIYKIYKEKYNNVPYIVLGFSLGSFVVRTFLCMYPEESIDNVILVGTGCTSNLSLKIGKFVANSEAKKVGEENSTEMINKLALENYNKSFEPVKTKCDWLCSNNEALNEYLNDPLVGKDVSCGLFRELLNGMMYSNSIQNIKKMNKNLKILLVSGKNDPVGNFSKGVQKLVNIYKKVGINNVFVKFYNGLRHDIFHEENHDEIFGFIYNWIEK